MTWVLRSLYLFRGENDHGKERHGHVETSPMVKLGHAHLKPKDRSVSSNEKPDEERKQTLTVAMMALSTSKGRQGASLNSKIRWLNPSFQNSSVCNRFVMARLGRKKGRRERKGNHL